MLWVLTMLSALVATGFVVVPYWLANQKKKEQKKWTFGFGHCWLFWWSATCRLPDSFATKNWKRKTKNDGYRVAFHNFGFRVFCGTRILADWWRKKETGGQTSNYFQHTWSLNLFPSHPKKCPAMRKDGAIFNIGVSRRKWTRISPDNSHCTPLFCPTAPKPLKPRLFLTVGKTL